MHLSVLKIPLKCLRLLRGSNIHDRPRYGQNWAFQYHYRLSRVLPRPKKRMRRQRHLMVDILVAQHICLDYLRSKLPSNVCWSILLYTTPHRNNLQFLLWMLPFISICNWIVLQNESIRQVLCCQYRSRELRRWLQVERWHDLPVRWKLDAHTVQHPGCLVDCPVLLLLYSPSKDTSFQER